MDDLNGEIFMDADNVNVPPESSGEFHLPAFPCLSLPGAGGRGWDPHPPVGPSSAPTPPPALPFPFRRPFPPRWTAPGPKSHLESRTRLNVPQEGSP